MLNCTKTATDCFVLEFSTADKVQNRICISSIITSASQEKEIKLGVDKEMEGSTVDSWFEERQDYYHDRTQKLFKTIIVPVIKREFQ